MSRRFLPLPLFAVVAFLAAAGSAHGAPTAHSAYVRGCHARVDFNLVVSSSRNMSCGAAKHDISRYKGNIKRRFRTPGGFACHRVSGSRVGGQWRCTKDTRAYRLPWRQKLERFFAPRQFSPMWMWLRCAVVSSTRRWWPRESKQTE